MNAASTPLNRAGRPPPLVPARLSDEVPLAGAAEEAFCLALSDEGLKNWANRDHREG